MGSAKVALPTAGMRSACKGAWNFQADGNDYSGTGNDLTANGGPSYVDDLPYCSQSAVDLEEDSNQYFTINNGTWVDLSPTTSMSLSVWINLESKHASSDYSNIITGDNGGPYEFAIRDNASGGTVYFQIVESGGYNLSSNLVPAVNTWYHIAVVFEANVGMYIYINGVLDNSRTDSPKSGIDSHTNNVIIGRRENASHEFDGKMQELLFFKNYALSAEEVKYLFLMGAYQMYTGNTGQYKPSRLSLDFMGAA